MSKKLLNRAYLLKILTNLVGVLGVSSLIPLPAFSQINPPSQLTPLRQGTFIIPSGIVISPNRQQFTNPTGTVTSSGGFITNRDGTFTTPSGTTITPDGTSISPNGWVSKPNGTSISPSGWVLYPNGTIVSPSGWVSNLNGTIISPNGEVTTLGSNTTIRGY